MLRRKILLILASLVGLLLLVAIVAIWFLQGVLADMNHTSVQLAAVADVSNDMASTITQAEIELREIQLGRQRHLDLLVEQIELLDEQTRSFGEGYTAILRDEKSAYDDIQRALAEFREHVGVLATVQDESLAKMHFEPAINASVSLRQSILRIGKLLRTHIAHDELATINRFRSIVLGLTIVFLVVINLLVVVFLRMSSMVLRPVEQLVEGSRRLAREEFDHVVQVKPGDEFAELATAYNDLARRLQANEARKIETLAQAAIMLNHELNNASAIIKLQLQLLERQSGGNPAFERSLRQINQSLGRMTATVEALKHVRRIVLTDYTPDTKMLDLERSVAADAVGVTRR
jgi:nitrate/nitrite-specific signal transduction histidine kinase